MPSDADELCVNLSSGTPQMQTAWLVAGSAGLLARARYFQVSRPLPRPHRPDERVDAVDTNFLREDVLIRQLHQAVRDALFVVAARCAAELAAVAVAPSRAAVGEKVVAPLMEAYTAWDLLDYPRALHRVRQVRERATGWRETVHLVGTLAEQERVLGRLARQEKETWPGLVDIWYNGVRCRQRGAHADCLARFYRLQEGCLYLRLREHGVEPRRLAESRYQGEP
ncbi:MAG: hypothetical protein H5T97_10655, partial [Firmicutes bacterium]|nr:hypothetical protein [Bacillota bacterium]